MQYMERVPLRKGAFFTNLLFCPWRVLQLGYAKVRFGQVLLDGGFHFLQEPSMLAMNPSVFCRTICWLNFLRSCLR